MTQDERQIVVYSAFAAIRRLVPRRHQEDLEQHLASAAAAFNEQTAAAIRGEFEAPASSAYWRGKADGKIEGMIAVECQLDRREVWDLFQPVELRRAH